MNFLAHLFLSGNEPDVMVGNFIGDFVRGRNLVEQFGPGIARGIELHWEIDRFTDRHPTVKESKSRLWPKYRHYSSVIVDVYYDHFLASLWKNFSEEPLEAFASGAYQVVADRDDILPERVKHMLPYMMHGNWLLNYARVEGIHRALSGMSRRTTFESKMEESVVDLKAHYSEFESEFKSFIPELQAFAKGWLHQKPS
ncbi:MAG: ACP phosphodiesterase [Cytophagales bacterium]|nr:ACP phosphodiesterase [Cytophagales bacterium]